MPQPAPICYVEIPAPSVEKATAFYRAVFGWTVTPSSLTSSAYSMFGSGDGQLCGGFDETLAVQDGGPILYLRVADIVATLAEVERAGGTTLRPKHEIGGGYGYSALFKDPNGNRLGLISPPDPPA